MKKTVIAMFVAASLAAAADLKVATVNMVHLVELHPTHESNKALVKSTNDDYKAKLDAKQDALKALAEEAKKIYDDMQNPMLSATAKADFQKKLEALQQKGNAARPEPLRAAQREERNLRRNAEARRESRPAARRRSARASRGRRPCGGTPRCRATCAADAK